MKRVGILALAGLFAIVGCSKKVEKQTKAAEQTQAVAKMLSGSTGSKKAPQLGRSARAGAAGMALSHVAGTTYDTTQKAYKYTGTDEGYTYTAYAQMIDANGANLGDIFHLSYDTTAQAQAALDTLNKWDGLKISVTASGSENRTMSADYTMKGIAGSFDTTTGLQKSHKYTFSGNGKWDDPKEKTNGTFTESGSETYSADGALTASDNTIAITGTADGDTFTLTLVENKDGTWDGTGTVNAEAITVHLNKDGTGTWTDSKGEKHDFKADS